MRSAAKLTEPLSSRWRRKVASFSGEGEAAGMRRRRTGADIGNSRDMDGDMKKPAKARGNRTQAGRMDLWVAEAHSHYAS